MSADKDVRGLACGEIRLEVSEVACREFAFHFAFGVGVGDHQRKRAKVEVRLVEARFAHRLNRIMIAARIADLAIKGGAQPDIEFNVGFRIGVVGDISGYQNRVWRVSAECLSHDCPQTGCGVHAEQTLFSASR